jgi:hypothetical protein
MDKLEMALENARVRAEKQSEEYWSLVPNERFYDSLEEMLERREAYIKELEIALFGKDKGAPTNG